jgi:hypothetical protein
MKILVLIGLLCMGFTGCFRDVVKEEKQTVFTKKVIIRNGCYYYISDVNLTVYDVGVKGIDVNDNNIIVVTYKTCDSYVAIVKVEDDK